MPQKISMDKTALNKQLYDLYHEFKNIAKKLYPQLTKCAFFKAY